jgi:hypothetical protein
MVSKLMEAADGGGRATLQLFEGSRIREGFWLEDDYRGFRCITLDWYLEGNLQKQRKACRLRLV